MNDAERLIREHCRVHPAPLVPEIRLYTAEQLVPLWQATEWRAGAPQPPPFWAFAWPGSAALARYILDTPDVMRGRSVLDFGSGSGMGAIASVRAGATCVSACDVDPLASAAQQMNAALNGVTFMILTEDCTSSAEQFEVILAGDVCYEREPAEATLQWLRLRAAHGSTVLLADPGRHYAPTDGLDLLATYEVPVLNELESTDVKRTRLWRLR